MAAKLSEELQRAVKEQGNGPIEVVDPGSEQVYFLIPKEQYDRLKPLFEPEPLTHEEQRALVQRAARRAGWDDPEMDAYDHDDHPGRPAP